MRGTGVGQKVKGKKWERKQDAKLERTRQAMVDMPNLILEWKHVSVMLQKTMASITNLVTAGSWSWLEEVPKREIDQIDGRLYMYKGHLGGADISEDELMKRMYQYNIIYISLYSTETTFIREPTPTCPHSMRLSKYSIPHMVSHAMKWCSCKYNIPNQLAIMYSRRMLSTSGDQDIEGSVSNCELWC